LQPFAPKGSNLSAIVQWKPQQWPNNRYWRFQENGMREIFGEVYIISTRNERCVMQPLAAEL
jgi:hypothetical protein